MIKKITKSLFASYYKPIEKFIENPWKTQYENFQYLVQHGRNTYFGQRYDFDKIRSLDDFTRNVPVSVYEDLRPYLDKILIEKQSNILWDTPVRWFAMSSGTTEDKSKYIPITKESLKNCHYRCGYHMLALYARSFPDSAYIFGKTLVLGGSQQTNSIGDGIFTGDVSAVLMKNLPCLVKKLRTPEEIALLSDWEEKLQRLADYSVKADIRALVGVPSWMLVLLRKIEKDSGRSIPDIWPNLEVFFHGGISFVPFQEQYEKMIPTPKMNYWETYNASEGFFGVQYAPGSKDMLLLLDNEVFYEFLPVSEWNKEHPEAISLQDVEVGKQYALAITTSGGLWRYKIGDTIEFTSLNPYLFKVTGRTKQFINAFGEEVIVDNADKALYETCKATGAKVTEYTAGPVFFGDNNNGAHQWIIEFETKPQDINGFIDLLDDNLRKINSDYDAKRSYDLSLGKPFVEVVEPGIFYAWMKSREKAGGQNKVPKLANDRKYLESLLQFIASKS